MIFVTVGSHNQPFNRLLAWIDEMAVDGRWDPEIQVQRGFSDQALPHCKAVDFLSTEAFQELVRSSRAVVTHGGSGAIVTALREGKKPIIVPRRRAHGEHTNDHQLQLATELARMELAWMAQSRTELEEMLGKALRQSRPVKAPLDNQEMLRLVAEFVAGPT